MNITGKYLEAALIDQIVAGTFHDKLYAFVAVITPDDSYGLGVAVNGERGYNPVGTKRFESYAEAEEWADGLNEHIGLDRAKAISVIASTMRR